MTYYGAWTQGPDFTRGDSWATGPLVSVGGVSGGTMPDIEGSVEQLGGIATAASAAAEAQATQRAGTSPFLSVSSSSTDHRNAGTTNPADDYWESTGVYESRTQVGFPFSGDISEANTLRTPTATEWQPDYPAGAVGMEWEGPDCQILQVTARFDDTIARYSHDGVMVPIDPKAYLTAEPAPGADRSLADYGLNYGAPYSHALATFPVSMGGPGSDLPGAVTLPGSVNMTTAVDLRGYYVAAVRMEPLKFSDFPEGDRFARVVVTLTMRVSYLMRPPRYRFVYAEPPKPRRRGGAPPLRLMQRDDGRTGGAPRLIGGGKGRQGGNRLLGGYL